MQDEAHNHVAGESLAVQQLTATCLSFAAGSVSDHVSGLAVIYLQHEYRTGQPNSSLCSTGLCPVQTSKDARQHHQ